jgi:hypothetical protein
VPRILNFAKQIFNIFFQNNILAFISKSTYLIGIIINMYCKLTVTITLHKEKFKLMYFCKNFQEQGEIIVTKQNCTQLCIGKLFSIENETVAHFFKAQNTYRV